jgi:hypothetical protein
MAVQVHPIRMCFDDCERLSPCEVVPTEGVVDASDQFVVVRRVDRPAMFRSVVDGWDPHRSEPFRVPVDERRRVLARGRVTVIATGR